MRTASLAAALAALALTSAASADVFSDYEDLTEGFYGTAFTHNGVTYRDVNQVSGTFPDGSTFVPDDLGPNVIVENAALFYNEFPDFGSPINVLTFGSALIDGDNLSLGALGSVWMDLDEVGTSASFDLAYYENGPWGGIEYRLDALRNGQVVATDSFVISDLGGRDNVAWRTMSVDGVEFDQLHVYAWLNGGYSGPRGIIDNLSIAAVPEPAAAAAGLLGAGLLGLRRRR